MHELLGLTLIELTEALRARKASPVDLMQAVLARIEATHADLNAVVALRDRDALRRRCARSGGAHHARGGAAARGCAARREGPRRRRRAGDVAGVAAVP